VTGTLDLWAYYERRADEYEAGTLEGLTEHADAIHAEGVEVARVLSGLSADTFVDVGAGTGLFTRHLRGRGIALDQSAAMLRRLHAHMGHVPAVRADGRRLPLRDDGVDLVFAGHLYGHLGHHDREAFLHEARRVGRQVVLLDSGRPPGQPAQVWEERRLRDGSRYTIFKRFFRGASLADEVDGWVLYDGRYFVIVGSLGVSASA
jgi:ubiquinone/menaquinone biosynthesis C-methylase UbiE